MSLCHNPTWNNILILITLRFKSINQKRKLYLFEISEKTKKDCIFNKQISLINIFKLKCYQLELFFICIFCITFQVILLLSLTISCFFAIFCFTIFSVISHLLNFFICKQTFKNSNQTNDTYTIQFELKLFLFIFLHKN